MRQCRTEALTACCVSMCSGGQRREEGRQRGDEAGARQCGRGLPPLRPPLRLPRAFGFRFALCYACNFVRPSVCNDDTEKQVGRAPSRRRTPGLHTLCSSALTGGWTALQQSGNCLCLSAALHRVGKRLPVSRRTSWSARSPGSPSTC